MNGMDDLDLSRLRRKWAERRPRTMDGDTAADSRDLKKPKGPDADQPHPIAYRKLVRM